ncbi:MAG: hypothetical protein EBR81_04430 [Proteobacteria bacterium]|nr:hypothetical protein [Pseudomonadota bacterium]
MTPDLFTPLQLGAVHTPNRIYLAPLTRCRAGEDKSVCPCARLRSHPPRRNHV